MIQLFKDFVAAFKAVRKKRAYLRRCEDNEQQVIDLYHSGMRVRDIDQKLNIRPNQIYYILSKNKVKPNRSAGSGNRK